MNSIIDLAVYFTKSARDFELSNARLTKMIYLTDWRSVLVSEAQVTDIVWHFDTYGPFVWDVHNCLNSEPELFETDIRDAVENRILRRMVKLKNTGSVAHLSDEVIRVAKHVVDSTLKLSWTEFVRLIYSTYPVSKSKRFTDLDLTMLGIEYKKLVN